GGGRRGGGGPTAGAGGGPPGSRRSAWRGRGSGRGETPLSHLLLGRNRFRIMDREGARKPGRPLAARPARLPVLVRPIRRGVTGSFWIFSRPRSRRRQLLSVPRIPAIC